MRASDLDLILVPETGGAPPDHWLTRWRAKLSTARLLDASSAALTPAAIVMAAAQTHRPILLIGHSTGAIAIAQAAPELHGADIRGAFFVAPPAPETLPSLDGGAWGRFPRARLPWPTLLVASRGDPWAPFARSQALAQAWGAELVDAGESGRIDADSGHGPWPDGLLRLAGFLKRL
jgi:predicted alpha/beta hydrolase family esterase